ncbi:MAG: DUF2442 domain-containing protein [Deltaproteobacteria bacterium]|jgi:hypothetical protein|nr:DUF2442 domain-containing protein [Deltaproteobacteria bacterium]MDL1977821.1 DUF2442 domain-containing protein [Deltaproteobacteria bacterium]
MIGVTEAKYIEKYKVHLRFTDGRSGSVDLHEFIFNDHRPIFKELQNENVFHRFALEFDTIVWANGADLSPEYLYFQTFRDDQNLNEQFRKWGYIS